MKRIIFAVISVVLILTAVIYGYRTYRDYYADNVKNEGYLFIPTDAKFGQILDSIRSFLKDTESFERIALENHVNRYHKSGRYHIKGNTNNRALIEMIKSGNQTPYSFRIKDFDTVYQMIGRVVKKTEIDSLAFIKGLDKIAKEKGLNNAEDLKPFFFIDTYYFFWTATPEVFFDKFEKQYNEFWNAERQEKEKRLQLSRWQIYALASIVYKESGGHPDEQRTIAGLYLNRYKKGMKLQSDPTVIYAVNKAHNFTKTIKRVYYKNLKEPSPYNTYANVGIPPGPICVVDKNSVDAVLNAEKHNYLFMCANPENIQTHKFTHSDTEHAKNAKDYQNWLNKKGIK